jgi:hypothetical protein
MCVPHVCGGFLFFCCPMRLWLWGVAVGCGSFVPLGVVLAVGCAHMVRPPSCQLRTPPHPTHTYPWVHQRVIVNLERERDSVMFLNRSLIIAVHPKHHEPLGEGESVFKYMTKEAIPDEATYRAKVQELAGVTVPEGTHTLLFDVDVPEM